MMEYHRTVMPDETLEFLDLKSGQWYLDGTLGDGGHTLLLAKAGANVWGLDQDPQALERAETRLSQSLDCPVTNLDAEIEPADTTGVILTRGNFESLAAYREGLNLPLLSGVLLDLGASTLQLTSPKRGFSFNSDAPLDMRMSPESGVTAADLVNALSEKELTALFGELGGEHQAKKIAATIVAKRKQGKIETTAQLADLIARLKPRAGKLHPATKVFQALRMAVNRERPVLKAGLEAAIASLKPEGRLVVISFHEGEDAIVKRFFKQLEQQQVIKVLTPKPVVPTTEEVKDNPRARSAKLRAAQKL